MPDSDEEPQELDKDATVEGGEGGNVSLDKTVGEAEEKRGVHAEEETADEEKSVSKAAGNSDKWEFIETMTGE